MCSTGDKSAQLRQAVSLLNRHYLKKEENWIKVKQDSGRVEAIKEASSVIVRYQADFPAEITPMERAVLTNSLCAAFRIVNCDSILAAVSQIIQQITQDSLADFDSQALATLVYGLGKVVKISNFDRCQALKAMEQIAVQLLQRKWVAFEPQPLTHLVNGLSQAATNADCRNTCRAMDRLAITLSHCDLTQFAPRQLAKLVTGLRKVIGRDEALSDDLFFEFLDRDCFAKGERSSQRYLACLRPGWLAKLTRHHVAVYILQRGLAKFELHQLASLVSSFSKGVEKIDGRRWLSAMDRIAEHLAVRLSQCNLANFESFYPIKLGLNAVAEYISQRDLATFEAQQLANVVRGLSKGVDIPDFEGHSVLGALDQVAVQLLQHNWAKLGVLADEFLKVNKSLAGESEPPQPTVPITAPIALYILRREPAKEILQHNLAKFTSRQLINLIKDLSQAATKVGCQRMLGAMDESIARIVTHLLRRMQHKQAIFEPQRLVDLLKGLSWAVGVPGCQRVLGSLAGVVGYIKNIPQPQWARFEGRALANLIKVLSLVVGLPGFESVPRVLDHIAGQIPLHNLASFSGYGLANLVKGLSRLVGTFQCERVSVALNYTVRHILQRNLTGFTGKELVSLLSELGKVVTRAGVHQVNATMICLARRLRQLPDRDWENFSSRALANLAKSISQVVGIFGFEQDYRTINYIALQLLRRDLADFDGQMLADLVNGLSKVVGMPGCGQVSRAMNALAKSISQRDWAGFEDQQLATLVRGLDKVSTRADCQEVPAALKHIEKWRDLLVPDGQALADVGNGLSQGDRMPGCRQVPGADCLDAPVAVNPIATCPKASGSAEKLDQSGSQPTGKGGKAAIDCPGGDNLSQGDHLVQNLAADRLSGVEQALLGPVEVSHSSRSRVGGSLHSLPL